ncbi:MAG: hypothetical protein M3R70_12875 [Actinomycetota bacterium]|nr:hypothetical protein [Actinomycetota bacterium]
MIEMAAFPRNMSTGSDVVRELEATTRGVLAADDFAEAAMRRYTWERRGWLGLLVRTPSPSAERRQERARTSAPPAMPARQRDRASARRSRAVA